SDLLTKASPHQKTENIERLVINEMAKLSRLTGEEIRPDQQFYQIAFHTLTGAKSLIALDLDALGTNEVLKVKEQVKKFWHPVSDIFKEYRVVTEAEWQTLPALDQKFSIILTTNKGHTEFA